MQSKIEDGVTPITVLSVSPTQNYHDALERVLNSDKWQVHRMPGVSSAVTLLQQVRVPLV